MVNIEIEKPTETRGWKHWVYLMTEIFNTTPAHLNSTAPEPGVPESLERYEPPGLKAGPFVRGENNNELNYTIDPAREECRVLQ